MAGLTKKEEEALQLFKRKLLDEFGDRLDSTQLFGSKARGDATKESDIDVLVTLRDRSWRDRRRVNHVAADVLFDTDTFISPKSLSPEEIEDMRQQRSMFWQSVEPELTAF